MKHLNIRVLILLGGLFMLALCIHMCTIKEGFGLFDNIKKTVQNAQQQVQAVAQNAQQQVVAAAVRYVRIEQQNLPVHVQELEVYDEKGTNVATKSKPSQSAPAPGTQNIWPNGFLWGGDPAITIDGNKSDSQGWPNCNHTDGVGMNYLELDLTSDVTVKKIVVYNRPDCCQVNLVGAKLTLLDQTRKQIGVTFTLTAERMQSFDVTPLPTASPSPTTNSTTGTGKYRYVKIENPREWEYLTVQELEVYDGTGKNVAMSGNITTSSVFEGTTQNTAIDGETSDTKPWPNSTCTNPGSSQWIELDLKNNADVKKIVVFNRPDCCQERLEGSKLTLYDSNRTQIGSTIILTKERKQTYDIPNSVPTTSVPTTSVPTTMLPTTYKPTTSVPTTLLPTSMMVSGKAAAPGKYRYVKIQHENQFLNIQELEVFDSKGTDVAKQSKASQSSDPWKLPATNVIDGKDTINHTEGGPNEWIELDLNSNIDVRKVVITNRQGDYKFRLKGAKLLFFDESRTQIGTPIVLTDDPSQTYNIGSSATTPPSTTTPWPTTSVPTTPRPTTMLPTTYKPTTPWSTTSVPTTSVPTTLLPTSMMLSKKAAATGKYRYVKIQHENQFLHIQELEVFDSNGTDVALQSKASQSSDPWNNPAANVVDRKSTINHTSGGPNEWLELDLTSNVDVRKVVITNRQDDYKFRLKGAKLLFFDESRTQIGTPIVLTDGLLQTYNIGPPVTTPPSTTTPWPTTPMPTTPMPTTLSPTTLSPTTLLPTTLASTVITGTGKYRYVKIENARGDYLTVQELEVYDGTGKNVARSGNISTSSMFSGTTQNIAIDGETSDTKSWPNSTCTEPGGSQWIELDLKNNADVKKVVVFNRPDCCQER